MLWCETVQANTNNVFVFYSLRWYSEDPALWDLQVFWLSIRDITLVQALVHPRAGQLPTNVSRCMLGYISNAFCGKPCRSSRVLNSETSFPIQHKIGVPGKIQGHSRINCRKDHSCNITAPTIPLLFTLRNMSSCYCWIDVMVCKSHALQSAACWIGKMSKVTKLKQHVETNEINKVISISSIRRWFDDYVELRFNHRPCPLLEHKWLHSWNSSFSQSCRSFTSTAINKYSRLPSFVIVQAPTYMVLQSSHSVPFQQSKGSQLCAYTNYRKLQQLHVAFKKLNCPREST